LTFVIVQRGRFATFAFVSRAFAQDPAVRTIWDRRIRDRRHAASPVHSDRRERDRRVSATTWGQYQYIVVNATDDQRTEATATFSF